MDGIIIISVLAAVALLCVASKPRSMDGMEDEPVSIENIRRGVKNGWYTCTLVRENGIPAVYLSGKNTDGSNYSDVFPVTQEDWDTLKAEGYPVRL